MVVTNGSNKLSHAKMSAFWSTTDDECCDKLGSGDFTVSIVVTRDKQMLARVDVYKPFRLTLSGLPIVIEDTIDFEIPKAIQDEVDEKVDKKWYSGYKGYGGYTTRWNRDLNRYEKWDTKTLKWIDEDIVIVRDTYPYWDDLKQIVHLSKTDSFDPKKDDRKYGDKPPKELFETCVASGVTTCWKCKYKKDCDEFYMSTSVYE